VDVQILDAQKCPASVIVKNSHKIIKLTTLIIRSIIING
jgi:hypothetical protein